MFLLYKSSSVNSASCLNIKRTKDRGHSYTVLISLMRRALNEDIGKFHCSKLSIIISTLNDSFYLNKKNINRFKADAVTNF